MIRLSADERRIALFLTTVLLAGAVVHLARVLFPFIDEYLGVPERSEVAFRNMTPADSSELAALIARAKGAGEEKRVSFPIDLNTAGERELVLLPGIGPAKARAILEHRRQAGGFAGVDELLEVRGIGPGTLEKLRSYVMIGQQPVETE
jgi:comEA protein